MHISLRTTGHDGKQERQMPARRKSAKRSEKLSESKKLEPTKPLAIYMKYGSISE